MPILHSLFSELKAEFAGSEKGKERSIWFLHTLLAIILPFTSSKTSNLLRVFQVLFGFAEIGKKRYYTFIASPKIPWDRLWSRLWKMIPQPETNGRLIIALDDYLNPKTGKKIFGCAKMFDHAAKQNQSRYPWAQNIVAIGLLKVIKGRWACLPLSQRYYFPKDVISKNKPTFKSGEISFQNKHQQAVEMLAVVGEIFSKQEILIVADSWFGNQGFWKPLRKKLGKRAHLLSRLRANNNLYGRLRTVWAYDQIVMQKTLKCRIRVVWVYRRTQWVALFTTDLSLSVTEIIEYYGARWKIEAGFKELKQDIGSAETQNRNPVAVQNHLNFCMMATSLTWIYACYLDKTPSRRHAIKGRNHFAFSDVRRLIAQAALDKDFQLVCPLPRKSMENTFAAAFMKMAA